MDNSSFPVSTRAQRTKLSALAAIVAEAERLRAQGVKVIDLGAGEPDFPTPAHIKDAAKRAIDENFTRYTPVGGVRELRQAVCDRMEKDFGARYDVRQCTVTVGGKMAIFNSVLALVNPGDDVLLENPCWVSFPEIAHFAEANVVGVDTEATDFHLTAEAVERAITPKSKLLIVNSPSNPTGRVIDPAEFRRIVEVAAAHNVYVISDECYLQLVYPPREPFSAATLPEELRARVMVCGSLSKTYSMTGWRLGYALGPQAWVSEVAKIQSQITSNANSIAQKAAIEALTGPQGCVEEMRAEYERRAAWLVPALNEIPGVKCGRPEGAFYAFPDVRQLMRDCGFESSRRLQQTLLSDYGVVLTSGSAFGLDGYLRLSFANSLDNIQEAVARIRRMRDERAG
jgi:aspartate aminotransferase